MSVPFMYPMTQQQALQQPTLFAQPNPFFQATCLVPVQVPLDPQQQIQQHQQAQFQLANQIRGQQLQLQLQQRTQDELKRKIQKEESKKQIQHEVEQQLDLIEYEDWRAEFEKWSEKRGSRPLTRYPPPPVQFRTPYHGRNPSISSAHSSRSQHTIYSPSTSQSQSMQGSPRTSSAFSGHGFPDMQRLSLASQASAQSLRPFKCPLFEVKEPEECREHKVRTAHGTYVTVNCRTYALHTGITPSRYHPQNTPASVRSKPDVDTREVEAATRSHVSHTGITPSRYHPHNTPAPVRSKPDVDTREVEAATRSYVSHLALAIWHQSLPGASRRDPAIKDVDNRLVAAVLDLWLATDRKFTFRYKFDPVGILSDEDGGKEQGAKFFFEVGDSNLRCDVESFAKTGKARLEREMFAPKSTLKEWIQWPVVGLAAGGKNGAGPMSGGGPIKLQPTLFKRTFIFLEAAEDFRNATSNRPVSGSFRMLDTSRQELIKIWTYRSLDQVRSTGSFLGCMQCDKRTRCALVRHPQTADWVCAGCWQYADPNKPQQLEWSRKDRAWRCDSSRISFPSDIQCGCLTHQRARLQSLECKAAAKSQKLQRLKSTEALSNRKETKPQRPTLVDKHERQSVRFDERVKQMGQQRVDTPVPAAVKEKPTIANGKPTLVREKSTIKKRPSLHRWPRSILRFNSVMKTTVEEEESDTLSSGATSVDATFGSGASKGSSTPPSSRTSSDEDAIPRP